MRPAGLVAFWLIIVIQFGASALAATEPRLALLIGNGDYTDLGRLENPVKDMLLMARTLRSLGFEVIELADADQATMKRAIQEFGQRLEEAGRDAVGLFYYAGHGVQVNGTNHLIPLRAEIAREPDVEIEAVKLDWVLAQMEHARNRLNILILDACRNNPLSRSFRSSEKGLSRIDAPRGTLIAYATAPGSVSFDGTGFNSPYTEALAETLREPGLVVESAFRTVRVRVMEATSGRQVPWESSSLTGAFYFNPGNGPESDGGSTAELARFEGPDADTATQPAPQVERMTEGASSGDAQSNAAELLFWESIKDSTSPELYQEYLRHFPGGIFAPIARQRLAQPGGAAAAAPEPERPAAATEAPRPAKKPEPAPEQVALAPAIVQPPRPFEPAQLAGRWEGRFRCQHDVIGMALDVQPLQGDRVDARFEFYPAEGAPSFPIGSFRVSGAFEREGRRLRLQAGEWIERPWGFQRHDLVGIVGADGTTIEGRILTTGCSEFTVQRLSGRS